MKRILTIIAAALLAVGAHAQEQLSLFKNSTIVQGQEYGFMYQKDQKIYTVSYARDAGEYLNWEATLTSNLKFAEDKASSHSFTFNFGAQRRYKFNNFLLSLKLAPYAGLGYNGVVTPKRTYTELVKHKDRFGNITYTKVTRTEGGDKEYDSKILYGVLADIALGFKIYETKSGKECYMNIGYRIAAPEFKTTGMFDNGEIKLGIVKLF